MVQNIKMKLNSTDISWYITIIVIVGLFIRVYQIAPNPIDQDEPIFVRRAVYCGAGNFNTYMPYAFWVYVLFLLYTVSAGIAFVLGIFHNISDVAKLYVVDPSFFYISGRLLSALIGTATIYATYRLGKSVYSKRAGIIAALLFTFFPIHVIYSRLVAYQIPATLFVLLSIWRISKISNVTTASNAIKEYLVAGFLIGISISTHPSGFLLIVPFMVSHALRVHGENKTFHIQHYVFNRTLLIGLGAILCGMFIGSPFFLIDYRNGVLSYLPSYMTGQIDPARTISQDGSFLIQLGGIFIRRSGAGYLLAFTIVISFWYRIWKRTKIDLIFLSFVGAHILVLAYLTRKAARDIIPIAPLLMLFVGVFLDDAVMFFKDKVPLQKIPGMGAPIYVFLVMALLAYPVSRVLRAEREWSKLDTRIVLRNWVKQNIPPGTAMVVEGLKIHPDAEAVREKIKDLENLGSHKAKQLSNIHVSSTFPVREPEIQNRNTPRWNPRLKSEEVKRFLERYLIWEYSHYLETEAPQQGYKLASTTLYNQDRLNFFAIYPSVPGDYQMDRFKDIKYFIFSQGCINRARENPQERYRLPLYEWVQQNATVVKVLKPNKKLSGPEILVFKRR